LLFASATNRKRTDQSLREYRHSLYIYIRRNIPWLVRFLRIRSMRGIAFGGLEAMVPSPERSGPPCLRILLQPSAEFVVPFAGHRLFRCSFFALCPLAAPEQPVALGGGHALAPGNLKLRRR
jgi:hypothetical protein